MIKRIDKVPNHSYWLLIRDKSLYNKLKIKPTPLPPALIKRREKNQDIVSIVPNTLKLLDPLFNCSKLVPTMFQSSNHSIANVLSGLLNYETPIMLSIMSLSQRLDQSTFYIILDLSR